MKAKNEARTISSLKGRAASIASIASMLLLAGCMTQSYPPAPKESATADYIYHIGALDTFNVIVWRNPELSMSVPVLPDGKITTPLIDDLPALCKTPTELERDMERR